MIFDGVTGVAGCFSMLPTPCLRYFLNFLKKDKKATQPPLPPAPCSNLLILFNPNDNDSHLGFISYSESPNPLILH